MGATRREPERVSRGREPERVSRGREPERVSSQGRTGGDGDVRPSVAPEDWARLSELLVREPDPDRLCEGVCRLLVERFGFARALVAAAEDGRLVARAGYDPAVPAAVVRALRKLFTIPLQPREDGRYLVAAWCVLEDEQVHVPDALNYRFRPAETVQRPTLVKIFGTREYVLTPVRGPSGVLGLLGADRRGRERRIDRDDLRILRTVGDLLGVALASRAARGDPVGEGRAAGARGGEPSAGAGTASRRARELPELLDVLREGLLLVAPDGAIRYLNRAASSLLDTLPWEAVGRPLAALVSGAAGAGEVAGRGSRGEDYGVAWRFRTPEGRFVEAQEERLGVSGLGLRGWRAIFLVDVTERVEEERSRDEFLATVVHDLAGPLQSIVGFAELLLMGRAGELNETQRDFLDRIERSGWEVNSLVTDIRALADLETGRSRLEPERIDPFLLVQEVVESLQGEDSGSSAEIVNDVPPDLPAVRADRAWLAEAVRRLGRWALEGSEAGEPVRVSGEAAPDGGWVRLRVTDAGREAGPEVLRLVLRRRALAGDRAARRRGLGLLLAHAIAEAHGGHVRAAEGADGGTAVVLAIPTARDPS